MGDWDWNAITVVSGEWWLLVIFLLVAVLATTVGYLWGRHDKNRNPDPFEDV